MIVDAILYNGERDVFDLRYSMLKEYVDEFVVCEFGQTFSGNYKEAHPINLPKVSYHFITQWKELKPNMPEAFQREYSQRETIKQMLAHLADNDVVFMGDCDEIWNPSVLDKYERAKLKLLPYSYWLNNRSGENFPLGCVKDIYGYLKNESLNDLRSNLFLTDEYFGWHFTNMGGVERLKYKIESYGHQEFNVPQIKDNLEQRMEKNVDYIGRNNTHWIDESDWPPWLTEHRQDYKHMIK